jgi:hypothetical protein
MSRLPNYLLSGMAKSLSSLSYSSSRLKISGTETWTTLSLNGLYVADSLVVHSTDEQLSLEEDIQAAKSGKPKGKAAIKAAIKKKKKAAGEDSDESDDFQPTKAKVVAKPKAAPKASPVKRSRWAYRFWSV